MKVIQLLDHAINKGMSSAHEAQKILYTVI